MRKNIPGQLRSKQNLGLLRSLILISDWAKFAEEEHEPHFKWFYKNQEVYSIESSIVIFIPVDFSRIFHEEKSHILLYGAGIYWTKFAISKQRRFTTDARYLTAILVPEEKWLNSHFNTEPFVFPPPHNFIMSDFLQEFPFRALSTQDDMAGYSRRAFSRGLILAQLVFPFKEPLLMLRKTTESYEEFDSPNAPIRVLISRYPKEDITNEIALEIPDEKYKEKIPGIRNIRPDLLQIFPEKWRNEVYLQGLRREIATISKDFAFIGAQMILN
ncbi:MAG: hypothetical protein ACFFAJ_08570 [Candidatus Hodarchaeota archaeon]